MRRSPTPALLATIVLTGFLGCQAPTHNARPGVHTDAPASTKAADEVTSYYLEIVSNDVEALCAVYEAVHQLSFGPEDPDLGQARVAVMPDGSLLGIRAPMADHEKPTMRTYITVEDIESAAKKAEESGALIAYPPTKQGDRGTFAIFIQGEVEHGLWQR